MFCEKQTITKGKCMNNLALSDEILAKNREASYVILGMKYNIGKEGHIGREI